MKIYFEDQHKNEGINKIELEDLTLTAQYIEGENLDYKIVGSAIIDGETYNDFTVEVTLTEPPKNMCIQDILNTQWDFYDYTFN